MKTKIFTAWTKSVEGFLNAISTEQVSYDELSQWMDVEAPSIFQGAQATYFEQNKARYLEAAASNTSSVRIDLPSEQVAFGFDKVFEKLIDKFPLLKNDFIQNKYAVFKEECFGGLFPLFIILRAAITNSVVQANGTNKVTMEMRVKNMESTLEAYKFLISASQASIESLEEFRAKMETSASSTVSRGPSSPVLHKERQEATSKFFENESATSAGSMRFVKN